MGQFAVVITSNSAEEAAEQFEAFAAALRARNVVGAAPASEPSATAPAPAVEASAPGAAEPVKRRGRPPKDQSAATAATPATPAAATLPPPATLPDVSTVTDAAEDPAATEASAADEPFDPFDSPDPEPVQTEPPEKVKQKAIDLLGRLYGRSEKGRSEVIALMKKYNVAKFAMFPIEQASEVWAEAQRIDALVAAG